MHDSRTPARTFLNCTWSEPQMMAGGPLWLTVPHAGWYCLALSDRQRRLVPVPRDRCATCPHWQPRAELTAPRP